MRKILVATALLFIAGNAVAQIAGTAHDFTTGTTTYIATGDGADELCAYCHTPHNSLATAKPLWNKTAFAATSFTAYGTTISGTVINNDTMTGTSLLCLGCHDGTVAAGEVANPPNRGWTPNATDVTGDLLFDADMSNDHPVAFPYADSIAATADVIADPDTAGYPLSVAGNMECSTCHDVHGAGFPTLLVKSNALSAMCQDCHTK